MPDLLFDDPFDWFTSWFDEARALPGLDATAMALATVNADGQPQARIVLLKHHDRKGFVFYTNHHSQKGQALLHHPRAGLNFYWAPIDRQIRLEGAIEPVSDEESDLYFASRPRESQIGAWASRQSRPMQNRAELLEAIAEVERRHGDGPIPRPPHWGGFRLVPLRMEFWMAGDFRLHDRWEFVRPDAQSPWQASRLFP
jgi:pyridoxamine 5'-phosphate oxidase